ncbi:Fic family protein [Plantactinospora soyae]|uniref:Fic family protein n=1 Tax=Plantactinospora soyae TaxID=1544732 RepID=A0A927MGD8_9ACTN|nr:Fic family protein [Plantactinospora soyae]MBE1492606.1 Fic family protein [Plantactinospora soyae]
MEAANYGKTPFGYPTQRPGDKWAFTYYMPEPLPRMLSFDNDTVLLLSEADNALGRLQGLGRLISQPELLVGPFLTREAIASSRIEGTNASLTEVLKAEEDASERTNDIAEVGRYLSATRAGLRLINTLPLTMRLIKEVHEALMEGVRGDDRLPGEVRRSPVWIGGSTPSNALFVPPLPEHLPELLTDWERFVNEDSRIPLLVRSALMHYQFETIHPFLDGNGRIGRLIIVLQLIQEQRLAAPLLYLSGYLETHRREYYDHLQAVRESGSIQGWIQFFCQAIKEQSADAATRATKLVALREKYYRQCRDDRSRVGALIPLMFQNPFITAKRVQGNIGGTLQGARNLLDRAASYGWLEYIGPHGRGGRLYYAAAEVLDTIESPTTYEQTSTTYS